MYQEKGFKACVSGSIDENSLDTSHIDRKLKRFLSKASLYAYLSALQATQQAGLSPDEIAHNPNIGIVAGSGGASSADVVAAVDAMRDKGLRGMGAMAVPKTMASTVSASVATGLKIGGISYSIASACATSTHCVGHAMELIQLGKQQINSIWVEAGPTLAGALLQAGLVDELIVYVAPKLLGSDARGLCVLPGLEKLADAPHFKFNEIRHVGPDLCLHLVGA